MITVVERRYAFILEFVTCLTDSRIRSSAKVEILAMTNPVYPAQRSLVSVVNMSVRLRNADRIKGAC